MLTKTTTILLTNSTQIFLNVGGVMEINPFVKRLKKTQLVFPSVIATIEEHAKFWVIRFKGQTDMSTGAEIEAFGEKWQRQDGFVRKHILLDFLKVTDTDSATVAGIIKAAGTLKKEHHRLGLINVDEKLHFMFELFKVSKLVIFFPSESEAIKELSR
jgi:anti-anti-sigma regulatory factor